MLPWFYKHRIYFGLCGGRELFDRRTLGVAIPTARELIDWSRERIKEWMLKRWGQ